MTTTFAQLGVPSKLADALAAKGIVEPFPVQTATIPDALAGLDVCGKAPTGSGKTFAFGLPLLAKVEKAKKGRPRALVLAPTRELAEQIKKELAPLAGSVGRNVFAIYGGVGYGGQISAMRKGVDILVACPGRLEDLIEQGIVDPEKVAIFGGSYGGYATLIGVSFTPANPVNVIDIKAPRREDLRRSRVTS